MPCILTLSPELLPIVDELASILLASTVKPPVVSPVGVASVDI